ncbi:transglycosylase SLT domain-containing protein [Hydrogenophaga sp. NFH-34]|uniref:transglycosylase SLT domain-containing protein n=1 Tax=Hydrogenophaga sp. NFH-34 TaxID=2744446 RepID=UPI001F2A3B0A|nr:transglycosylase SLT domain-containing protein [Hydrogenophaga sp. NFH-34]
MRSAASFLKLLVFPVAIIACAGLVQAGEIDVFTCKSGQLTTVRVKSSSTEVEALIRSGNAIWSSREVDAVTVQAIAEGRGIWALTPDQTIFNVLKTKTPSAYMAAIANQESGRKGRFWPWTINYAGKGYFFTTKSQAIAAARQLIERGAELFDVGLMQVNWFYHGNRFASIEQAFDPVSNIRAADDIVQEHLNDSGSMQEALGRYHSKTPSLKAKYQGQLDAQLRRVSLNSNLQKGIQPC